MKHAIDQLSIALEVCETNAPINEAAGAAEQAALEREIAASCRAAIAALSARPFETK